MKFTWKYPDVSGLFLDGIAVWSGEAGKRSQQRGRNFNLCKRAIGKLAEFAQFLSFKWPIPVVHCYTLAFYKMHGLTREVDTVTATCTVHVCENSISYLLLDTFDERFESLDDEPKLQIILDIHMVYKCTI